MTHSSSLPTTENTPDAPMRRDDPARAYKVLVADLLGLKFAADGQPDHSAVREYIESKGGVFHRGAMAAGQTLERGKIHFFYEPNLSRADELLAQTAAGQYDATIVAATFLPAAARFELGGVRIGAGTGNMGSASWGGANGEGGVAPLMNTPGFNARATAQMAMKALLKVLPDLPVQTLHDRVVAGDFDTGKNLCEYPTEKLEGKRIAILGYGNIGREMAKLAQAFGMKVAVYAHEKHQCWIESEGFEYAATPEAAAQNADVISPHIGLGALDTETGVFANAGLVNAAVLGALNDSAVVVNYDRGEVIDAAALDAALGSGKVRYACIDADLFVDPDSGALSGPMVPYRELQMRHAGKMELLPHAAADTEHVSRVEGAKQAVDQIFDVIQYKRVTNLKGDLPDGYTSAGVETVKGVGKVTARDLAELASCPVTLNKLKTYTERMAAFWGAVTVVEDPEQRLALMERHGAELVKSSNYYASMMAAGGVRGPFG